MKYKSFYLLSLLVIALASSYPLYMGALTLGRFLQKGYINTLEYPKYLIPYVPICTALLTAAALMPVIFRLFRRHALAASSTLGLLVFLIAETGLEKIRVIEGTMQMPLESWQLSLCMATPEVLRSIGKPIYAAGNPAFKVHFYIISALIILVVLSTIYGISKMLREQDFSRRRPLVIQGVSILVFIGLCILACLTAFYRNGTINISPLSSILMSIFFIVFGITAGTYCGSILYGKGRLLMVLIPAAAASLTTLLMYIGELTLMGGVLFRYGSGILFEPLAPVPFSIVDIAIILFSGFSTFKIMDYIFQTEQITSPSGSMKQVP